MSELPAFTVPGPAFFENWRSFLQNPEAPHDTYEYPLFSDAAITGEPIAVGPYRFINTIAHAGKIARDSLAPVLVLRVADRLPRDLPRMGKTDFGSYHGGSLIDEVAALVALTLGIRVKAGPIIRTFDANDKDPRGTPVAYYGFDPPAFQRSRVPPLLPQSIGPHCLDFEGLRWVADSPQQNPKDEIALIRAARLYQDALWIADAEPAMAWLLLVSAIETAADRWDRSKSSSIERLRASKPDFVLKVEALCPDLVAIVAGEFADLFRATQMLRSP